MKRQDHEPPYQTHALNWYLRTPVLFGASIVVAQCFAGAAAAQQPSAPSSTTAAATVVVMLPPVVSTEVVTYGTQAEATGNAMFERELSRAFQDRLDAQEHRLLTPDDLSDPTAADLMRRLEPLTSRLARGAINDEARDILARLAARPEGYVILVQFMQVKQGPGASWNSMTGAITSSMSSTLVQAALISTRTGSVEWKNEVFERKIFRPGDSRFEKVLERLYSTLGNGGGTL